MTWRVEFQDDFEAEFLNFERPIRVALLSVTKMLEDDGPMLARPHADTLKGSKHANMKELRFAAADGEWRAAFAFDPERKAIVLVAGDKSGGSEKRFYKKLIAKADLRFSAHLEDLKSLNKGR